MAALRGGGYLIADTGNNRIRRVSRNGLITTVAGTGVAGYSGDGGTSTVAQLDQPQAVIAVGTTGFLVSDTQNNRIRLVSLK